MTIPAAPNSENIYPNRHTRRSFVHMTGYSLMAAALLSCGATPAQWAADASAALNALSQLATAAGIAIPAVIVATIGDLQTVLISVSKATASTVPGLSGQLQTIAQSALPVIAGFFCGTACSDAASVVISGLIALVNAVISDIAVAAPTGTASAIAPVMVRGVVPMDLAAARAKYAK